MGRGAKCLKCPVRQTSVRRLSGQYVRASPRNAVVAASGVSAIRRESSATGAVETEELNIASVFSRSRSSSSVMMPNPRPSSRRSLRCRVVEGHDDEFVGFVDAVTGHGHRNGRLCLTRREGHRAARHGARSSPSAGSDRPTPVRSRSRRSTVRSSVRCPGCSSPQRGTRTRYPRSGR